MSMPSPLDGSIKKHKIDDNYLRSNCARMTNKFMNRSEYRHYMRQESRVIKAIHIDPGIKTGFQSRFKTRASNKLDTKNSRKKYATMISKQRVIDRDLKYGYK
jgi:hypothetical protein